MSRSIYTDSITRVSMLDSTVRLELATLVPIEGEKDKLRPEVQDTLVTTLPGVLRIYDQLTGLMVRLEEQGLVKRRSEGEKGLQPTSAGPKAESGPT